MKVSIVIPVYNAEKYLVECLDSALNQTYSDIEIIAIDDGSTDKSLEILRSYSDRIKIVSKKNGGTASAFNAGIRKMSGEWFKWLSADDVLYDDAITVLVDEVKKLGKKSENCIFYTNYDIIDSAGNKIKEFIEPNYNNLSIFKQNTILLDHFFGTGITSLIHKSAFRRCGLFDEKIDFQEDYEFWLRCCFLHDYRLHLVPKVLAKYRTHEQQLTQTRIKEVAKHSKLIRDKILSQLDDITREKYLKALDNWPKKRYPLTVRLRRQARDAILKSLPDSLSEKIIKKYLRSKKS